MPKYPVFHDKERISELEITLRGLVYGIIRLLVVSLCDHLHREPSMSDFFPKNAVFVTQLHE